MSIYMSVYVRACAVRKKAGREHPRERISLELSYGIIHAKQAVVTRGETLDSFRFYGLYIVSIEK